MVKKKKVTDIRRSATVYGSRYCICPKCKHKIEHERGVPCSTVPCPKCGTFMRGEHCI